jgi:hypothetical protein
VKLSEFREAVRHEFGDDYGRLLTRDLVIPDLGERTADAALSGGVTPRAVWLALCAAMDVPAERRHGAGLPAPRT